MHALALTLAALAAAEPDDPLTVTATLPDAPLVVGERYEIELRVDPAEGISASKAGHPKAFLEIDVPPSVTLEGRVIETYDELKRNEFLREPFERLIDPGTTRVAFTLTAEPAPAERIGLNVIAYLREGDDGVPFFVRRRVELPLTSGAHAEPGDPANSSWGGRDGGLQIGDTADPFTLPRADGSTVSLFEYKGKKNVIVTTYRAFW